MIFLKRDVFHATLYYEQGRNFPWMVPTANLAVMMVPGLLIAIATRLRTGLISLRFACFVFATLAIWGPLLRAPLYGGGDPIRGRGRRPRDQPALARHARGFQRFALYSSIAMLLVLATTAVIALAPGIAGGIPRHRAAARAARRGGECAVDRHGYRPGRQPGALRLQPRHEPAPRTMGREGACGSSGPSRPRPGRSPRTARS